MSSYEKERSSRRSRMSGTMDSTQHSAIDMDPRYRHRHNNKEKKKSSLLCISITVLVIILGVGLLVGGTVLLYRSKDKVQTRILVLVHETSQAMGLEQSNGTSSRIVKAVIQPIFDFYQKVYETLGNVTKGYQKEEHTTSFDLGYLEAAIHLKKALNESVNPCEDFFEFSCGEFIHRNPIPDDQGKWSTMVRLEKKVKDELEQLFASTTKSTSAAIEKLRQFYNTCLDYNQYGAEAIKKTQELIKKIGPFPMLDGSEPDPSISFASIALQTARHEISLGVLKVALDRDIKNHNSRVVLFTEGSVSPRREVWLDPKGNAKLIEAIRTAMRRRLEEFAKDMGLSGVSPTIEQDIDDLFTLNTRLAEAMKPLADQLDYEAQYNMFNFEDLTERFHLQTGLNLRDWLMEYYPKHDNDLIKDTKLKVMITFPDFEDKIIQIIKQTSPKTWLNYFQYRASTRYQTFFPEKYRDIQVEFNKVFMGTSAKRPRRFDCLDITGGALQDAFGALYVRKHFDADTKRAIVDMIGNLREAFEEIVAEAEWMDEETRSHALAKSRDILAKVGYRDFAFDDAALDKEHEELKFRDGMGMVELFDEVQRWNTEKYWRRFLDPFDRTPFDQQSAQVNAFYSPIDNAVILPAGILQEPMYKSSWPKALAYAGIGMVIGHEITHGFDSSGKTFDENGHLNSWWTNETTRQFLKKAECMVEQYGNVEEETIKMKINGKLSLTENIADNGGIREAFRAYQKLIKKTGQKEYRLPGYDYTPEQLFFIGYAQNWCGSVRPATMQSMLLTDNHSPLKTRVNVVVSNQPEFAEAFKCPAGSAMNPEKKCKVW